MKKKLMGHKKPQHTRVFSKGRAVSAQYDSENDVIRTYFLRPMIQEIKDGESISEFNKKNYTNFILSKSEQSLITPLVLSPNSIYALRKVLKKSLSDYRKEMRGKAYKIWRRKEVEDISSLVQYLARAERELEGKFEDYK